MAQRLGFHYLDSGSLYRLVALAALRGSAALEDERRLTSIAAKLGAAFDGDKILLDGKDVSDAIRSEEVSAGASKVAALPGVRSALLARQRAFRRAPGLAADGRDMGTVVFPDAVLKVFLTATPDVRAERRYKQLMAKGLPAKIQHLLRDLRERDARDAARSVAPLQHSADAALLDTSGMTIAEAVDAVLAMARARGVSC